MWERLTKNRLITTLCSSNFIQICWNGLSFDVGPKKIFFKTNLLRSISRHVTYLSDESARFSIRFDAKRINVIRLENGIIVVGIDQIDVDTGLAGSVPQLRFQTGRVLDGRDKNGQRGSLLPVQLAMIGNAQPAGDWIHFECAALIVQSVGELTVWTLWPAEHFNLTNRLLSTKAVNKHKLVVHQQNNALPGNWQKNSIQDLNLLT